MPKAILTLIIVVLILISGCATSNSRTKVPIPADMAFVAPFVERMEKAGLRVIEVRPSVYESFFAQFHKAAWIRTDLGIVDLVFFDDEASAGAVHVRESTAQGPSYEVRVGEWQRVIKNDKPFYFITRGNVWVVTQSKDLSDAIEGL